MAAICAECNQEMTAGGACTLDGGRVRWGDERKESLRLQFQQAGVGEVAPIPGTERFVGRGPLSGRDLEKAMAASREYIYAGARPCPDCAVRIGGLHHPGCDQEECPGCHLQAIGDDCGEWAKALARADNERTR